MNRNDTTTRENLTVGQVIVNLLGSDVLAVDPEPESRDIRLAEWTNQPRAAREGIISELVDLDRWPDDLSGADIDEMVSTYRRNGLLPSRVDVISATDLMAESFPPIRAYIDGFLFEGLTILGGKPKLGKSWWALSAGVTIATGGVAFGNPARSVRQGRVLYLALEDGRRRIQRRLTRLLPDGTRPDGLEFAITWPRFDDGGVDLLADKVDSDGFDVVFVDTVGRVRRPTSRSGDSYLMDTEALAGVHDLAKYRPGLAVVLIHHTRKQEADDFVDSVSGTSGMTGVPDHVAVLERGRGTGETGRLQFTSRDAAEHDTSFEVEDGAWKELGSTADVELSEARRKIRDGLVLLEGEATNKELADVTGLDTAGQLRTLKRMQGDGLVTQTKARGPWQLVDRVHSIHNDHLKVGAAVVAGPAEWFQRHLLTDDGDRMAREGKWT